MGGRQSVRIIGGEWRGRRLNFPTASGLRPTGDRLRETLFNWLRPELAGRRVLDLFAGSGVLGLEALSRGAVGACFVERDRRVAAALVENIERLRATSRARVAVRPAEAFLRGAPSPHDLIFLDPPFRSAIIGRVCELLAAGDWLARGALVYLEFDRRGGPPPLPERWRPHRETATAGVGARLLRVE